MIIIIGCRSNLDIRHTKKILVLKIALVAILSIVAILSLPILLNEENVHFKHALEWNYFVQLAKMLLYYLS